MRAEAADTVLDLDLLRQQTGGDEGLMREVLTLFRTHAPADLALLAAATGYDRRVYAHRLVGSARGVGAGLVAQLAASVEAGNDGDVSALAEAVRTAADFIEARFGL